MGLPEDACIGEFAMASFDELNGMVSELILDGMYEILFDYLVDVDASVCCSFMQSMNTPVLIAMMQQDGTEFMVKNPLKESSIIYTSYQFQFAQGKGLLSITVHEIPGVKTWIDCLVV